jgi:ATP-dependent Lon protease
VGGLKEKLTAAARAGVATVLVPARNKNELADVPDEVKQLLDIRTVETLDDVLEQALLAAEAKPGRGRARAPARAGRVTGARP